ncbi:MAG: hypothetical protein GTO41_08555 [Burkholderiales bacterium]|nr:hypothetical protein [Burkholderiales bacterium]
MKQEGKRLEHCAGCHKYVIRDQAVKLTAEDGMVRYLCRGYCFIYPTANIKTKPNPHEKKAV